MHVREKTKKETRRRRKRRRAYRRWWKRFADGNSVKECIEVPITTLVIVRIFHAVHEHAAQASVV